MTIVQVIAIGAFVVVFALIAVMCALLAIAATLRSINSTVQWSVEELRHILGNRS